MPRGALVGIAAAGGDGTINEVVNGIADAGLERGVALGILPSGTMNVLSRELGLPGRNLEECWKLIENGEASSVDLWRADDQYFVQVAGVGLDADIIANTSWEEKNALWVAELYSRGPSRSAFVW